MEMGLWPETLEHWHHEGLPNWVTSIRHLEDYLRLDRSFNVNWLPINNEIDPPSEERALEETEEQGGWASSTAPPDAPTQRYLYRPPLDGSGRLQRVTPADRDGTHQHFEIRQRASHLEGVGRENESG